MYLSYFSMKTLWVLISSALQNTSEYQQHILLWRNKKNMYLIYPLIKSFVYSFDLEFYGPVNTVWSCLAGRLAFPWADFSQPLPFANTLASD